MIPRMAKTVIGSAFTIIVLVGCGDANPKARPPNEPASTATVTATHSTDAATMAAEKTPDGGIQLISPAVKGEGEVLSARYTCNGANISPPLRWSGAPADTKELALFMLNFYSIHGTLYDYWALAGLHPGLRGLVAGAKPSGAIPGRNSLGQTRYSVCPPKGRSERYIFVLYALPRRLGVTLGFNAVTLRQRAFHEAKAQGFLTASYTRH